jgi:hypothetical protein
MRYLLWLSVLVICLWVNLNAQQTQSARCPEFIFKGPEAGFKPPQISYIIEPREASTRLQLTYTWEASVGTISQGQGTKAITFEPGAAFTWTVAVKIGGLPSSCQNMMSLSSIVEPGPPDARKFSEITSIRGVGEKAQLDAFAKILRNLPPYTAIILVYSGRKRRANESSKHAANAKEYLVKEYDLERDRITIVEGGIRDKETLELWLLPIGATLPVPDPPRLKPQ